MKNTENSGGNSKLIESHSFIHHIATQVDLPTKLFVCRTAAAGASSKAGGGTSFLQVVRRLLLFVGT